MIVYDAFSPLCLRGTTRRLCCGHRRFALHGDGKLRRKRRRGQGKDCACGGRSSSAALLLLVNGRRQAATERPSRRCTSPCLGVPEPPHLRNDHSQVHNILALLIYYCVVITCSSSILYLQLLSGFDLILDN